MTRGRLGAFFLIVAMAGLPDCDRRPTAPTAAAARESGETPGKEDKQMPASFYEFETTSLDGRTVDMRVFNGKVALAVNVASECGFTPQYKGLQELYERYKDQGLVVMGFPSNEFGGQEPGDSQTIKSFCERNYGVTFPIFSKRVVKKTDDQDPLYRFLTFDHPAPNWNFCKYLVGKDGQVISFHESRVKPSDLSGAIEDALGR